MEGLRVRKERRVKSVKREGVSVGKGEWLGVGKGGRIKCWEKRRMKG